MTTKLRTLLLVFIIWLLQSASHVISAQADPILKILYSFNANSGYQPHASVLQARDGNFYGTTFAGGAYGRGTVYKITPNGTLTVLHNFSGGQDGAFPNAGLIQGKEGYLYGTEEGGGDFGYGSVFQISTNGKTFNTLCHFDNAANGAMPLGGVIQATDGMLYGVTSVAGQFNRGTIYRVKISRSSSKPSQLTTLYSFGAASPEDGSEPFASLIQADDGALYGTTYQGGPNGYGTVFRISLTGDYATLYLFTAGNDGANPRASLIQAADGNLYSTTEYGGMYGSGIVFRITTAGALTTLYSFTGGADGGYPYGNVIQANDTNFYGTTYAGSGSVFQLNPLGVLTTLYAFNGFDGSGPYAGMIQGSDGNFYGTTLQGGLNDSGTVFEIIVTPVVTTFRPVKGPVGTKVTLTGANFTGVTSVRIGTIAAAFSINSDASLTLTVPTGALSGKIIVTNNYGQGMSSTKFTVTP